MVALGAHLHCRRSAHALIPCRTCTLPQLGFISPLLSRQSMASAGLHGLMLVDACRFRNSPRQRLGVCGAVLVGCDTPAAVDGEALTRSPGEPHVLTVIRE